MTKDNQVTINMTSGDFDPCSTTYEKTVTTPGGSEKKAQCVVTAYINASGMATLASNGPNCKINSNPNILTLSYDG